MAEFRRPGGDMVAAKGPQYRTTLLPIEQQVCEAIGITTEEYFQYHDLLTQHQKEEQGREGIPDIRNEPVTIVTLVIGLALQAVSMLLAPKPRGENQQKPQDFKGSDVRGRTKFSPLTEFDSVQELATLAAVVPLVFCNRENSHGGVRVESQLLWSRLRNRRNYQELAALLLFSAGEVQAQPDYEGYAFGQSKLGTYMSSKIALYFKRGKKDQGPILAGQLDSNDGEVTQFPVRYPEGTKDIFIAADDSDGEPNEVFSSYYPPKRETIMLFCGTVTPSQTAQFGAFAPMRNGHAWKYPFLCPGFGDAQDSDAKEEIQLTRKKHLSGYHPGRTNTIRVDGDNKIRHIINFRPSEKAYLASLSFGPNLDTTTDFESNDHIDGDTQKGGDYIIYPGSSSDSRAAKAGGITEGVNSINQSKAYTDSQLEVGEMYMFGDKFYRCIARNPRDGVQDPFDEYNSNTIEFEFEFDTEQGLSRTGANLNQVITEQYGPNAMYRADVWCPIQKFAVGQISNTRPIDMVEIGIKSTVYRQINGYPNIQEFQGYEQADKFAKDGAGFQLGSINAYYARVSIFRLQIRKAGGTWIEMNGDIPFAVYGSNAAEQYNMIRIIPPEREQYEYRFIPMSGANFNKANINRTVWQLEENMSWRTATTVQGFVVSYRGFAKTYTEDTCASKLWRTGNDGNDDGTDKQTNPGSLFSDYWFFDADKTSHENQPEHQITWINEYLDNEDEWYDNRKNQYNYLAYAGMYCQSSNELSQFSNVSAYFRKGIRVELFEGGYGPTNLFPEICYALLTNRRWGAGELVGDGSTDKERLRVAAKFCDANGFYWDGVISERINIRDFLFEQAGYQLLDFTIIGGRFSLYPSVPFTSNGKIDNNAKVGASNFEISGLFTNGNVRNFTCTMNSPEDRQLFTAEVQYRKEVKNGFPESRSIRVRLDTSQGGYFRDPIEVFDMTQFCTTRAHALKFAKSALRIRQGVDHTVQFETTPDSARTLTPGCYIRVAVSIQHAEIDRGFSNRLRVGSITNEGLIQPSSEGVSNGTPIYYWKPGTEEVLQENIQLEGSPPRVKQSNLRGTVFSVRNDGNETRVYKVETLAYGEDGMVEIAASHVPLTRNDTMKILDWEDKDFVIEEVL